MNVSRLILKEIAHRKINFAMCVIAVSTAVALFVTFMTSGQAYRRETRRIMRDMGQNLRIIPKETTMDGHKVFRHTLCRKNTSTSLQT